jgi:predicted Fe-Mo cluster-binding NifX family protein
MRLGIASWNGRVSPVFDTAAHVLVVDVDEAGEQGRREEAVREPVPARRVRRLVELGVEVLICGAVSRPLATLLAGAGIQLVPWVAGPVDEVLAAYLGGRLPAPQWAMPGCACQHPGPRGPRGRRRGRGPGQRRQP